jgi:superfamily II DNA or RNA helicase
VIAPTLRPYQTATLDAVADHVAIGERRLLVKKPTGTGKTVTFAAMPTWDRIEAFLGEPKHGARMLVIAHREELLDQAVEKIQAQHLGWNIEVEQGERVASSFADVIVASIQTLAARKFVRLQRLLRHHDFRLVIIDEAHHAAAPTYRTALVHLGFLPPAEGTDLEGIEAIEFTDTREMEQALAEWDRTPQDKLLVGVTATPNRTDAVGLGCVFQSIAFAYDLKDAIKDGYLVPIEAHAIESDTSLDEVRTTAGEFNQKDLAAAVDQAERNALAVSAWQELAEGKPTLGFTVDVAHAHSLAEAFRRAGYDWVALSGETPKDERRAILARFRRGELQGIANCMILTEGTDLPMVECILHAKPTKSATLYEQMTGRGLRPSAGKDRCVVIDIVDVTKRHSLQTAPVLYGLPPGLIPADDQTLDEMAAALQGLQEQHPNLDIEKLLASGRLTLAQLHARAQRVDVWKLAPLSGAVLASTRLDWLQMADLYRVSYPWEVGGGLEGTETLVASKDLLGKWELATTWKQKRNPDGPKEQHLDTRQRTLGTGYPTEAAALVAAELWVSQERRNVMRLLDRTAGWKAKPASEKQLDYLKKLRVPFKEPLTMGEAGQLINVAKARRYPGR